MAPFDIQPIKSLPAPRAGNIVARSSQSGTMDHHTMIDVVVMIVIFVALLISLSVLAWCRPTSSSSLRAIPVLRTSVPVANTATPVRSTATPGRSIRYSRQILVSFLLHNWWTRASHDGIPRTVTNTSPSLTTFAPTSASGAPSIVDTFINSEAVELQILGGSKPPSASSLAVADDITDYQVVMSATEPIARVDAGTVPDPS